MATLKFACIPTKYAPKRKMIDFSLPQWRTKLAEFDHPDLTQWANSLYQSKVFNTPQEFNAAYDLGHLDTLYWRNKPMVLTAEDVDAFVSEHTDGAFDDAVKPGVLEKLIVKMRAALASGEKTVFVY
jgi:hypothetical protein